MLCFFDEYGKCIDDGAINNLCKPDYENQIINLFCSTTKWQQINLWLKTLAHINEPSVNDYTFFMREKKIIIDENQILSSITDQTESIIIDIIDRNTWSKVILTFEINNQTISVLTSMKIYSLLNNENILKQLNLTDVSSDDCILVLREANEIILTKDYHQKPIGNYSIVNNELIHFQISISVQITKYDNKEPIRIPLSNRNITVEQLLNSTEKSIDVYKYLATNDTKRIVNSNEILSNLNKTKFILVKENETCLASIKKSNNLQQVNNREEENEKLQRFIIFATIADIIKENQADLLHILCI
ncbi:unnamed protein product [Rotaria sp. Silwood1]|nr:unnamed protein product [Rotaria sp. Silwood1]